MTEIEFARRTPRLVAAVRAVAPGAEIRPLDLAAHPPAVEAVPPSPEAAAAIAGFDWSGPAQQVWEDAQRPERTELRQQAAAALQSNADFLALASPSTAETLAQVRALTRQASRLIRRLVQVE